MDSKLVAKNINDGTFIHKPNESKKKQGRLWKTYDRIFTKNEEEVLGFVFCRNCRRVSKYDSKKGISNLNDHSDKCNQQPRRTLRAYVTRTNSIGHDDKKMLCVAAIAASVKDTRPFNLTEGSGVSDLIHFAWNMGARLGAISKEELLRTLPDPTTVSRNVNRLSTECKQKLKSKLQKVLQSGTTLALTTDIWQDKYKRMSYLCITLHYFDEIKGELLDFILTMCPLEAGRKKDNIYLRQIIEEKLIEYGLLDVRENLVFVSDRGGNIRLALINYTRLNCFPHFLHNIVKYACSVERIKQLIDNCAALVRYFKFNGLNNLLGASLKSAISTRFNYVYMMLSSIENEWDAIEEVLLQRREQSRLANIDRECIKLLITFLSSFNIASKLTESTKKETLAHVWILVTQICTMCRVQENDPIYLKAAKARSVEYIESKFILHKFHRIATFLHPNYKSLVFCSSELKIKTIRDAKALLNEMLPQTSSPIQSQSNSNSSSRRSSTDSDSSFLSNYYNRCEDVLDEVDVYLNLQWVPEENINVFQWWTQRRTMFQNLSKVALKMHSIPASSLQSERTFSLGGLTISDRRSNLNPTTVEDLILLNKNYDFEVRYSINFFSEH